MPFFGRRMDASLESLSLDGLIDRLGERASSPDNRRRESVSMPLVVGIEEPIAWTHLFGFDANRYFSDPHFYAEQTLRQKLWRFEKIDDDLPLTLELPAWLGHYPEYTFVGLEVSFAPSGIPLLQEDHPLRRDPDLRLLAPVDFASSGWMPRILRWYEALERLVAGRLKVPFLTTWWRGCLDLAVQLRGYENLVQDTVERPEFVHDLLGFLTEQRCRWHEEYCRYFGVSLGPANIGDDWLNVPFITPAFFAEFVLPRYLEIEAFHGRIAHVHSCGNQAPLQEHLLKLKTLEVFEVSPWTDLTQSLANLPPSKRLAISLHPNEVLVADPEEMRARLQFIATACKDRQYRLGTAGLTPIRGEADFVARIHTWLAIARQIFASARAD